MFYSNVLRQISSRPSDCVLLIYAKKKKEKTVTQSIMYFVIFRGTRPKTLQKLTKINY